MHAVRSSWPKLLVFHNTSAGSGDARGEDIIAAFDEANFDVEYRTKNEGLPPAADLAGLAAIVIAGGDGTVAQVLAEIAGTGLPCTIVPIGGANNVATSLGIPPDPWAVARALQCGRIHNFRLGLLKDNSRPRVFVEGCGLGAFAASLSSAKNRGSVSADQKNGVGRETLLDMLRDAGALQSRLRLDGRTVTGHVLFIEALNVPVSGPSLPLAPLKVPGGDPLQAAILNAERRDAFMEALAGNLPLPVDLVRCRKIDVEWIHDPFRIDDDFPDPPASMRHLHISSSDLVVPIVVPRPFGDQDGVAS